MGREKEAGSLALDVYHGPSPVWLLPPKAETRWAAGEFPQENSGSRLGQDLPGLSLENQRLLKNTLFFRGLLEGKAFWIRTVASGNPHV